MKQYNGEKAVISLTSWKARINTVSKTIYSLIQKCPGFHIVLVLSEEEFPKKEAELPDDLMLFVNSDLIEILWVYKNYKSFKKVLFTMDKYRDIPVISADDDCIYTCNYAQELYDKWLATETEIVKYNSPFKGYKGITQGPCTFYSNKDENFIKLGFICLKSLDKWKMQDDMLLSKIIKDLNYKVSCVNNKPYNVPYYFHTKVAAINPFQYKK